MIQIVHDKIVDFCGVSKIPCVIVGSKSDLYMSCVLLSFHVDSLFVTNCLYVTRRQVDAKDGEKLAKTNDCAWIETSAKNNVNVGAYFVPNTTYFPASLGLLNDLSS